MPEEIESELTFWEKAVWLKFNPSWDDKVGQAKKAFANLIDLVQFSNENKKSATERDSYMMNTLRGMAIRSCITAQMAVVKFLTWKD